MDRKRIQNMVDMNRKPYRQWCNRNNTTSDEKRMFLQTPLKKQRMCLFFLANCVVLQNAGGWANFDFFRPTGTP